MTNAMQITVKATDGFSLSAALYEPSNGDKESIIFIAPATGVKQTFYAKYASFMANCGFRVITFDFRGIGGSLHGDIRKLNSSISDWGEKDIAGVIDWITEQYPRQRLLAVTHSIGGQMVGLAHNNDKIDAMINIGVQSGYLGMWSGLSKLKLIFLWYFFVPLLSTFFSYFPSQRLGMGENMAKRPMLEWARWCRDPQYLFGKNAPLSTSNYGKFRGKILSISFSDDTIAPLKNVEFINRKFGGQLQHRHLKPSDLGVKDINHFGCFKESLKDSLWVLTANWFIESTKEK